MLRTIELHTDFPFLPAHVDAGDKPTPRVANDYLGPRAWQTSIHQQQSGARFLWRLGARIHQLQCLSELNDPAAAGVPPGDCLDVRCSETRCAGQCIESHHRLAQSRTPPQVVRGARRRGYRDTADPTQLAVEKAVAMNNNAVRGGLGSDELRGTMWVQPSRPEHGRCRQARHRRVAIGPQPRGHRPVGRTDLNSFGDVYVAVDHLVSAAQRPPRRNTRRDSFSA